MYAHYFIYTLLQGGSSEDISWGKLKEIHLNYTTIAWSEDITASKAPSPLSINILVLMNYLYFTQGASSA